MREYMIGRFKMRRFKTKWDKGWYLHVDDENV